MLIHAKNAVRAATLLLALMAALSAFTGCRSGDDDADSRVTSGEAITTAAPEEEETKLLYSADIPEGTDYDGYNFRIYTYDDSNYVWYDVDFSATAENGETINDAVYRRMKNTEDRLGVSFTAHPDGAGGNSGKLITTVRSDEDAYDMASITINQAYQAAQNGALIDFYSTDVDLAAEWWDQNAIADMSIVHKLFMLEGDISVLYKKSIGALLFNKEMYEDNGLANPYEKVSDKTWTFDYFAETVKTVAADLNGDSVMDKNDRWGILIPIDVYPAALIGCGVDFCVKDADDIPQLAFYNERTQKVYEMILAFAMDESHVYGVGTTGSKDRSNMFSQGQALYTYAEFHQIEALRQMDTDFGILPMPLYESSQESYAHCVNAGVASCITVPVTNRDLTRTAYVLDTLGAESKNILTPAYIESYLKGKGSRDNESEATLDLIFATLNYDIGFCCDFGQVGTFARDLLAAKSNTLASAYEKRESSMIKSINKFVNKYN